MAFAEWLTSARYIALFPAKTIIRDPYHRESPIRRAGFEPVQNINLGLVE